MVVSGQKMAGKIRRSTPVKFGQRQVDQVDFLSEFCSIFSGFSRFKRSQIFLYESIQMRCNWAILNQLIVHKIFKFIEFLLKRGHKLEKHLQLNLNWLNWSSVTSIALRSKMAKSNYINWSILAGLSNLWIRQIDQIRIHLSESPKIDPKFGLILEKWVKYKCPFIIHERLTQTPN